jgi:hypothetical protein
MVCGPHVRMRSNHADEPSLRELVALLMRESGTTRQATIPKGFDDDTFMFMAQFFLPNVKLFGSPGAASIGDAPCLVDLTDRSWARVTMPDDSGTAKSSRPASSGCGIRWSARTTCGAGSVSLVASGMD